MDCDEEMCFDMSVSSAKPGKAVASKKKPKKVASAAPRKKKAAPKVKASAGHKKSAPKAGPKKSAPKVKASASQIPELPASAIKRPAASASATAKAKAVKSNQVSPNAKQQSIAEGFLKELELKSLEKRDDAASPLFSATDADEILLGSDCAGLGTDYVALQLALGREDRLRVKLGFTAEKCPQKRKWMKCLEMHFGGATAPIVDHDILERDVLAAPKVDIFVSGSPCPPFSSAGLRGGLGDSRGWLILHSVHYALIHRPPCVLIENVAGLVKGNFKPIFQKLVEILRNAGYSVKASVLNSYDHGLAQSRGRICIAAIKKSAMVPGRTAFPE